ncbi:MAG: hypothetical protein ACYTEL_09070 [Planctomycetota bacterium]
MTEAQLSFSASLMEYNMEIPGQLRPATVEGKDQLVFIRQGATEPYIRIWATDLAAVKISGFFTKKMVVTTRTGIQYHFKGRLARIFEITRFLIKANPEGIKMSVSVPARAAVGEKIDLTVEVSNERLNEEIDVSKISISDEYLLGFEIIATNPPGTRPEHLSLPSDLGIPGCTYFTFKLPVAPSETARFVFTLSAQKQGSFAGSVCVAGKGMTLSSKAETTVVEAG